MKIWQVNVYGRSHETLGTYFFDDFLNARKSILTTWSKSPNEIRQLNMQDEHTDVWVYSDSNGVAVECKEIDFALLTAPTHF